MQSVSHSDMQTESVYSQEVNVKKICLEISNLQKFLNIAKLAIFLNIQNRNILLHNHSAVIKFSPVNNSVILLYYLSSGLQFYQLIQYYPLSFSLTLSSIGSSLVGHMLHISLVTFNLEHFSSLSFFFVFYNTDIFEEYRFLKNKMFILNSSDIFS